jgi:hypothetical protein
VRTRHTDTIACRDGAAKSRVDGDHRMMIGVRLLSGIAGALLLLLTIKSVLRNLVVPRGSAHTILRTVWQVMRPIMHVLVRPLRTYLARDAVLAWLAPLVIITTLLIWLAAVFLAYGLLLYSLSSLTFTDALREAGSSLFTLGFASSAREELNSIDFVAAATGPLVLALLIGYLPTLYGAYNRRETEVTLLQSRAGEPAWGPELLARQALVGTVDELTGLYSVWERLAADVGESHANYAILISFRSPRPYRNWIVGLLTVMDAAALHMSLAPTSPSAPAARLMVRSGFTALRDIARVTGIRFNPDPLPDDPITLTYEEYVDGVRWIEQAGFRSERSIEDGWSHFRGWRVNYENIAYEIARRCDAVPALWSGPRDWPDRPLAPIRPTDRKPGAR